MFVFVLLLTLTFVLLLVLLMMLVLPPAVGVMTGVVREVEPASAVLELETGGVDELPVLVGVVAPVELGGVPVEEGGPPLGV